LNIGVAAGQVALSRDADLVLVDQSGDLAQLLFVLKLDEDVVAGSSPLAVHFLSLPDAKALDKTTAGSGVEESVSKLTHRHLHIGCVNWAEPHRFIHSLSILIQHTLKLIDVDLQVLFFHFLIQFFCFIL
jgi:hypothetical protein